MQATSTRYPRAARGRRQPRRQAPDRRREGLPEWLAGRAGQPLLKDAPLVDELVDDPAGAYGRFLVSSPACSLSICLALVLSTPNVTASLTATSARADSPVDVAGARHGVPSLDPPFGSAR